MQLRYHIAVAVGRLAAAAPIQPLAWEPPDAAGIVLKNDKKMRKKERKERKRKKEKVLGSSHRGSAQTNLLETSKRTQVRSLALLSGLRIWCCHEL